MKPRLLDLFCGAGGAGMGYHRAGFDVVGVDIAPQKHYPFTFIRMNAIEALFRLWIGWPIYDEIGLPWYLSDFDAIHASPPCQGYSRLRHLPWLKDKVYPMLIDETRKLLNWAGLPYVIENVEDAPLLNGVTLCGQMFGLPLYRHRKFESCLLLMSPSHSKHTVVIGHGRLVNDRKKGSLNASSSKGAWGNQTIVTVAGGQYRKADGEKAMGITWMSKPELSEAIPPAYTEFIGAQLMAALGEAAA